MTQGGQTLPRRHIALLTEYDGSHFCGWQTQANGRTVQETIEKVLGKLSGTDKVHLRGCSRTDSGVHARGHVSHFKTTISIPAERLPLAMNSLLPDDVSVLSAVDVSEDFHAQYHAQAKIYSYQIWNHPIRPAIDRLRVSHVPGPLDLDQIKLAIPHLIGRHDFSALMDTGSCDRDPTRTLKDIQIQVDGPLIILQYCGDGFLYHMVRILTGTLIAVGQGKIAIGDLPGLIRRGDRRLMGKTMPPQGLYLERVIYEPPLFESWFEEQSTKGASI